MYSATTVRDSPAAKRSMTAALCVQAEAGAVLALRRNPQVCNRALHDQRAYHRMPSGRSRLSSNVVALFMLQQHSERALASYRVESDMPSAEAFTITAPGVLLRNLAILSRPLFCLANVFKVFTSSFDQATRVSFFFLGMYAPF
jgi:hypothetical protein